MEGIFEAILQIVGEVVFGIVEDIAGETIEIVISSDYWIFLKPNSTVTNRLSTEINQLNILNIGKENLK